MCPLIAKCQQSLAEQSSTTIFDAHLIERIKAAASLNTSSSIQSVTESLLKYVGNFVEYNAAMVQVLVNENEREIIGKIGLEDENINKELLRSIPKDPLISKALDSNKVLILSPPTDDPNWQVLEATKHIKSWACAPLMSDGQPIGLLILEHWEEEYYQRYHKDILNSFANLISIALRNANLFVTANRLLNQLTIINQIGKEISSNITLSKDDLLQLIYEQTSLLMDVTNFYIAQYDANNDRISFVLSYENGEPVKLGEGDWKDRVEGNGMTEYVIRSKNPLLIKHSFEEWRTSEKIELIGRQPKTWIGAPMYIGNEIVGVIASQDYEKEFAFDDNHVMVLQNIAAQAAISIRNIRLLEESKNLYDSLKEISSETVSLTSETSHGELFRKVSEILASKLYANVAIYICNQNECENLTLKYCSSQEFKSNLRPNINVDDNLHQPGCDMNLKCFMWRRARSRNNTTEGLIAIVRQKKPKDLTKMNKPFTWAEEFILVLVATAFAYTFQNLRWGK